MRGVQLVLQGRGVLAALLAEESKRLLLSVLIARSVACSVIVPAVFARDNSIPCRSVQRFAKERMHHGCGHRLAPPDPRAAQRSGAASAMWTHTTPRRQKQGTSESLKTLYKTLFKF